MEKNNRAEPHLIPKRVIPNRRSMKKNRPPVPKELKKYFPKNKSKPYAERANLKGHIRSAYNHRLRIRTRATSALRRQARELARMDARYKAKKKGLFKTCNLCHETKTIADFDLLHDYKEHDKKYRMSYCHVCRKKINREYYLRRKNANA